MKHFFSFFLLLTALSPSKGDATLLSERTLQQTQGYALDTSDYISAYSPSARFEPSNPWNTFFQVSYLYWQPIETGLDLAKDSSSSITEIIRPEPNFTSSYKVAAGVYLPSDDWLATLEYTRYHKMTGLSLSSATDNSLFPVWFGNALTSSALSNATAKWHLQLDSVDGTLSRSGYVGKSYVFQVVSGLKLGWIRQSYSPTYTFFASGKEVSSANKAYSWLLGPEVGLNNRFFIGNHFHLYGNLLASLCYQKYRLKSWQDDPETPILLSHNIHYKDSKITPVAIMSSGVGFDVFASQKHYHISATVGYEFQGYYRQNLMRELVENVKTQVSRASDNLYLQGITAQATLDF